MKGKIEHRTGCVLCGAPLTYFDVPQERRCEYCGHMHKANAACTKGHFVCDTCHRLNAEEAIEQFCTVTEGKDPIAMAITLMQNPRVMMHGPEHHFLVPAVLLAAYYNTIGEPYRKARALGLARERSGLVKGGSCGLLGDCGAAVGTGIFVSIITRATPLSHEEWQQANLVTAKSLTTIAEHGGPRCCKRNTFLAIKTAVTFVKEEFGISIPVPASVRCTFFPMNRECREADCPFYP